LQSRRVRESFDELMFPEYYRDGGVNLPTENQLVKIPLLFFGHVGFRMRNDHCNRGGCGRAFMSSCSRSITEMEM